MIDHIAPDSFLTSLDFRSKLLLVGYITVLAFLWDSPVANGGLLLFLIGVSLLARMRPSYLQLIVKVMAPFFVLVLLAHGFWNTEPVRILSGRAALTPLFTLPEGLWLIGGGRLSLEGVLFGLNIVLKTLSLSLVIPLAVFTTNVDQMVISLVRARVPYKVTFIFSATLRFFPILFEEIQLIIEAQRLRGLALERMGFVRRVRVYSRIAVPLILSALVRAQQLEVVLHSKAFTGGPGRTYLHDARLSTGDWIVVAAGSGLFILFLALYGLLGVGRFSWLLYS